MNTEFFTFNEGVLQVDEFEDGEELAVRLKCQIPEGRFFLKGIAKFNNLGLTQFSLQTPTDTGPRIYEGFKEGGGLMVKFRDINCKGSAYFEAGSFDLTTLDLLVLDATDLMDSSLPTHVSVLDPIELDIAKGRLTSFMTNQNGNKRFHASIDFDGEIHQLSICGETGRHLGGQSAGASWKLTNEKDALSHLVHCQQKSKI